MKKIFLFSLLLGAFWLLNGCRGETPTSPVISASTATQTAASTQTASPTLTLKPTSTPTPTSSRSPTPFEVLPWMQKIINSKTGRKQMPWP